MRWVNELTKEQRAGLMLLTVYGRVRRDYQAGYQEWDIQMTKEILETRAFKISVNVATWLMQSYRWDLTHQEVRWTGYVKHAFKQLAPTIPHLAQLKNPILLKRYFSGAPAWTPVGKTPLELDAIYSRVLIPELKSTQARAALGLRPKADYDLT